MTDLRSASSRSVVPALVSITLCVIMLVLVVPGLLVNLPRAYTGIHAKYPAPVWPVVQIAGPASYTVDRNSPAYAAGLRDGVRLGCMGRREGVILRAAGLANTPAYYPGATLHFCANQGNGWRPVTLQVAQGPVFGYVDGTMTLTVVRIATILVFFICGIALLIARPGPMTWAFFFFCLGSVPTIGCAYFWAARLPEDAYKTLLLYAAIPPNLAALFLVQFVLRLPNDRVDGWRAIAYRCAQVLTAAYALYYVVLLLVPENTAGWVGPQILGAVAQTLAALATIACLFTLRKTERPRFAWAALAIFIGLLADQGRTMQMEMGWLFAQICGTVTVIVPIVIMYAILKRHLIDIRFVISRTVVYAALTTLVVGVIGIADWLTSVYLSQTKAAMAVDAAVTITLGFVLHRTYRWFESVADVLLFRKKHQAQSYLERLAKSVLRAKHEETVDRALTVDPHDTLELTMAALFRIDPHGQFAVASDAGWSNDAAPIDADHDLVRFICTERATIPFSGLRSSVASQFGHGEAAPSIAVPLFQDDDLTAFALYGAHRDGTNLDPDEVSMLEHLCNAGAQAYTRIENLRYREAFAQSVAPRLAVREPA